jgi:DNA-binding transcriptional LysR family regulator
MQKLEEELGESLFIRTTRRMELSEFGRKFLSAAVKIDEAVKEAEQTIYAWKGKKSNVVTLGTAHHAHLYEVTNSVMSFKQHFPDIQIRMIEKNMSSLKADFRAGRLSLVTAAIPSWEEPEGSFIKAGEICLCVLLPADHYLASYDTITLQHLNGMNLIIPEEGSIFAEGIRWMFYREGISAGFICQGSPDVGKTLLKTEKGIMIEEETIAARILEDGIVMRRLEPEIRYIYGLEYSLNLNENEKKFVKHIRKLFPEEQTG